MIVITQPIKPHCEEACKEGNKALEFLESKFKIHVFPNGNKAKKARFSKNGGACGGKHDLVTNLAYLKTPFNFYAKITTLNLDPLEEKVNEVLKCVEECKAFKKREREEEED